jgi:putative transposase
MVERNDNRITRASGMNTWRAGCGESRTSGSEGGPEKPTHRKMERALRSDPYTEHPTGEGKLYCCLIKDLFSNRIVGYSINERMTKHLAVNALRSAIARRRFVGTVIVHSDRGSAQFRSRDFVAVLKAAGLSGSMGRVAAAGDNAAMESFNSLLQKNVLNRQQWKTRDDLRYAIIHWVEHTYNRRRRQRRLGRLTPVEFELAFTGEAA